MAHYNAYMGGMIASNAAPDDDPLAQCLGVYEQEAGEGGALHFGEMGEGQMHGLGRVESSSATYVGFWERGMYQGPGLLLDHDEGTRQEGVFKDGVLAEGSSASATVDRQGRRGADGVGLEGQGVKVLRDAAAAAAAAQPHHEQQQQPQGRVRVKELRGAFVGDQLDGRGSAWCLLGPAAEHPSPSSSEAAAALGRGEEQQQQGWVELNAPGLCTHHVCHRLTHIHSHTKQAGAGVPPGGDVRGGASRLRPRLLPGACVD